MSRFKGTAKSRDGDAEKRELPPPGNHAAVLIGLIDLGTQDVSYGDKKAEAAKVMLIWELTSEPLQGTTNRNHVIACDYRLSHHSKAALRQGYESWLGRKLADGEEYDYAEKLAHPCLLNIVHGKGKESGNEYAKVDGFGPILKGMTVQPPRHQPFVWTITGGLELRNPTTKAMEPAPNGDLPEWEWLPFLYGRSVHEVIADSPEWKSLHSSGPKKAAPPASDTNGTSEPKPARTAKEVSEPEPAGSDIPW